MHAQYADSAARMTSTWLRASSAAIRRSRSRLRHQGQTLVFFTDVRFDVEVDYGRFLPHQDPANTDRLADLMNPQANVYRSNTRLDN